jgi:2-aminoadipate transaminase
MIMAKQGVDLFTSSFNQALAAEYLLGGHIDKHIPKIIELYRPRRKAMLAAMDEFFPKQFTWSAPDGGMFVWAEGPEGFDIMPVYKEALKNGVAFVPGRYFYTGKNEGLQTMRLNFTMVNADLIKKSIEKIGTAIKKAL